MDVYLALLWASLRSQASYRRSFLLEVVGRFWVMSLELAAVVVLVGQAGELSGFGRADVVYLYGMATMALGLAEALTDGLNDMPELVRLGTFDGILVRPRSPLLQVLGRQCRPLHAGRVLQGLLAAGWGLWAAGFEPTPARLAMLVVQLLSTAAVFGGLFVAEGATTVFTVQSGELFNAFTYGGQELTKYPVPLYGRALRAVFLWVVPVGFTSWFPALVVLGRADPMGYPWWTAWASPLVAGLFVLACVRYWAFAVARYRSTGS